MKIWTSDKRRSEAESSSLDDHRVPLLDQQERRRRQQQQQEENPDVVDLFIFYGHPRCAQLYNHWISQKYLPYVRGRPKKLDNMPQETWDALFHSIVEAHRPLYKHEKFLKGNETLAIFAFCLMVPLLIVYLPEFDLYAPEINILVFGVLGFLVWLVGDLVVVSHLRAYADEVFHPSIRAALERMEIPLAKAGFEVRLVEEENVTGVVSLLRFTPIPRGGNNGDDPTTTAPALIPVVV